MGGKIKQNSQRMFREDFVYQMATEIQALYLENLELKRQLAASRKQVKDAAGFLYARSKQMEKVIQ